jgi:hypothetical protein
MNEPKTDVRVQLSEGDGNAFAILGKVKNALRNAGHEQLVKEYLEEATSGDYDHLLQVTMSYVHVD